MGHNVCIFRSIFPHFSHVMQDNLLAAKANEKTGGKNSELYVWQIKSYTHLKKRTKTRVDRSHFATANTKINWNELIIHIEP